MNPADKHQLQMLRFLAYVQRNPDSRPQENERENAWNDTGKKFENLGELWLQSLPWGMITSCLPVAAVLPGLLLWRSLKLNHISGAERLKQTYWVESRGNTQDLEMETA